MPTPLPSRVLWDLHNQPALDKPTDGAGVCSLCREPSTVTYRVKKIASDKFTGWDDYTHVPDPLWCESCAWVHTVRDFRTKPWIVTPTAAAPADRQHLHALLSQPLAQTHAVIIPLSRHKHLMPLAQFGALTTDDRQTVWTRHHSQRFNDINWLTSLGVNESTIHAEAPPYPVIKANPQYATDTLQAWARLAGWRTDPTLLNAAMKATLRPKTAHRKERT